MTENLAIEKPLRIGQGLCLKGAVIQFYEFSNLILPHIKEIEKPLSIKRGQSNSLLTGDDAMEASQEDNNTISGKRKAPRKSQD